MGKHHFTITVGLFHLRETNRGKCFLTSTVELCTPRGGSPSFWVFSQWTTGITPDNSPLKGKDRETSSATLDTYANYQLVK